MSAIVITIDGPAGAGKSTTARMVAEALGYTYIDTGAMYRAVTLAALQNSTPFTEEGFDHLCKGLAISLTPSPAGQRTFLNGSDVTSLIRSSEVTNRVSEVSSFHSVRTHMVFRQRELGLHGGIVMDGRDIGSVVFPNAQIKVFLDADLKERSRRRHSEFLKAGTPMSITDLEVQIQERDRFDTERAESPLVRPEGSVLIDTTHLTINEQVAKILALVSDYQRTESLVSKYLNF